MGDAALIRVLEGRPRLKTALKIAVPLLVVLLTIIYVGVSYVVASGVVKSSRKPLESDPSSRGLQYEEVEFSPREGDGTLSGWYLESEVPGFTIVLVHGINANREEGGDFLDLAAELVEEGFNVLLFDLRGHGASDGDRVSYGFYERHDVLGAFDFLVSRGTSGDDIGVLGRSLGAGTVLLAAAKEPRIQALVANSPYADSTELIAKEIDLKSPIPEWLAPIFIPGTALLANVLYAIDIGELTPVKAVARLNYPILVMHGTDDQRIPFDHGRRVYQAAHPESEFWINTGLEHVEAFSTYPDEYVERVATYFNERLAGE